MGPADTSTVVTSEIYQTTVGRSDTPVLPAGKSRRVVFWITENGDLVPQGRVKRITLAQDVINSAEESVYDTLWTARQVQAEERDSRIVQAGYDYLGRKTRLSKKTIQRIVAKLIDKDFIAIERPADIYQRTSTVYRVFSYKTVLERHVRKGRSHVAKMGPGFSYVQPLNDPRSNLSTVSVSDMPTVVDPGSSTADGLTTETVVPADPSTVVRETTILIGNEVLGTPASSAIHQALRIYGAVDDEAVRRLIRNCRQQAPDCTEEEIVHFIAEKGALVRVRDSRIHSPVGFLLTTVPKCFSGEAFRLYRSETTRRREAEQAAEARRRAELEEWGREQERLLADPTVSEEDKQFIRQCLGIA
jgi:predicted transcriptional regulator